ncbi:uncharacterized protein LOC128383902 [Scomber japonicus]|uniref:uncharacterized protein LOC128383288 n=1 Tax=Scomber japonicus TaxID=13676 RepID=UPI00230512F7|nr:uncharacterized protein LOC128383288 [Scomber japonicus]XP_053199462.1 uncharacterized protein LOC128383902 [Scomber japonicus]
MTSPVFVLYLTCLFVGRMAQLTDLKSSSSVHRDSGFISANVGEEITLQCLYQGNVAARLYWYKQTLGQKMKLISTFYKYELKSTMDDEFKNISRFTLDTTNGQNHLKITDLNISDSATYYCISCSLSVFHVLVGTTLNVKGSALVHQSASESIQPGGSVTLNCTVHTGTCDDGEHSVYWFKNSEESHSQGLIYTHGGRNDQCMRNTNTQTHTCVYNLPMKSLNLSHAGTYYCAVASCGQILFGDGTKLDVGDEVDSLILVYFLSGALAFTTILSVLLAFSMYKMKRNSCQSEPQHGFAAPSTAHAEGHQDTDNLHYAAFNASVANRSRKARNNTNSECVYSSVKM